MKQLIEKWQRWLPQLRDELFALTLSRQVYKELGEILASNPAVPPSILFELIHRWHLQAVVMGVRRMVKRQRDSISLAALLQEIQDAPTALTREWYRSLWNGSPVAEKADATFDRFSGAGGSHVDPGMVQADLNRLLGSAAGVEQYTDRLIAHLDQRGVKILPTYDELDASIALIGELVQKYGLLLEASGLATTVPFIVQDWKAALRVPWLAEGAAA